MLDEAIIKMIVTTWRICKWFFLQIFLMYLMPYLWNNHYNGETICLILLYTVSYAIMELCAYFLSNFAENSSEKFTRSTDLEK